MPGYRSKVSISGVPVPALLDEEHFEVGTSGKIKVKIGAGGGGGGIPSTPPTGNYKVVNVYVNTSGKIIFQYDDVPGGSGQIASNPPTGNYQVMNIYVNTSGKIIVQYEDTPV